MKTAGKIISTYGDSSNGVLEIKDQDSWVWKLTGYNIGQYWDTTNDILKMRNFYGKIQLIAGSAGTEGAVIEVANGGTLTVPGLSTLNGGVSITKDGDAITLNHSTATSYSGIKFNSKADITDNAYIRYYSDSSNFDSGIYDLTSSTENGLLIFGIENDEDGGGAGEVLALRGGNRVIIDVKTSHSGDQDTSEIVEFRYEGAVKSYIAANGKFMGSAETVDGKHSTDLVLLDGTQMMTGNLGFKNDAGGSVSMYKADGTTLLGKYRVDNTGAVVVSSDSGTNRTIVLRPSGADASANEFVVSGSGITYNANIVWHAGNFDPSTKSNTDHNHTYNVNDGWFRYLNDAATVRLFGNQRQMAFRTDGVTEYAVGVTPNPFTWQYGGDASTNSLMQISTAGGIWTKAYGWLGDYFLGKTAKAADSDKLDNLDSTDFLRSDNTSEQIISAGEVRIQSTTSTERMVMEFNETDSSLDFVYYTS
jgi:hypothetical protein